MSVTTTTAPPSLDPELVERVEAARKVLLENSVTVDQLATFPHENFRALFDLGLFGLTVPVEHGGWGLGPLGDLAGYRYVITRLSSACSGTGQCFVVHSGIGTTVQVLGTGQQQERFYAALLRGEIFASAGSEEGQRRTTVGNAVRSGTLLTRDGDGYRLSGSKFFCTNSAAADWLTAFAVYDDEGTDRTVNVMVRSDDPGVVIHDSWDGFGQRSTSSGAVEFHDVPIPADRLLGDVRTFESATQLPSYYQFGFTVQLHAIAEGALEFALDYLHDRAVAPFGLPSAAHDPIVALEVAKLASRVYASRSAVAAAGRALSELFQGNATASVVSSEVALAKETATLAALDVSAAMLDLTGARSVRTPIGADRFWRNARALSLHDSLDRRRVGAGWAILGVDPAQQQPEAHVQFRL